MGGAKHMMMEHEDDLHLASAYLVQIGILERCEYHDEIFGGGTFDLEKEFWRNAMADRKRGDNGPIPWAADMEAREFTDLLKEAYESNCGEGCYICDKNAAD